MHNRRRLLMIQCNTSTGEGGGSDNLITVRLDGGYNIYLYTASGDGFHFEYQPEEYVGYFELGTYMSIEPGQLYCAQTEEGANDVCDARISYNDGSEDYLDIYPWGKGCAIYFYAREDMSSLYLFFK